MQNIMNRTRTLLGLLGHNEEPFGVHYTDVWPEGGFGPKKGELLTREREAAGAIDWQKAFENFSCIIRNIWLARKKKKAAWISHEECGCMGGGFYCGLYQPYLDFNVAYVSTGVPGTPVQGEHYLPSPESMRAFMDDVTPPPAPAKYCVFKPLSQFDESGEPEVVAFFVRGEALVGLNALACYAAGSHTAVISHFGAACTQIIGWPRVYRARGEERAVIGGLDPSARKFMKTDELTFAAPFSFYRKMLDAMRTSALTRHTWQGVRTKVLKSRRTWGEEGDA